MFCDERRMARDNDNGSFKGREIMLDQLNEEVPVNLSWKPPVKEDQGKSLWVRTNQLVGFEWIWNTQDFIAIVLESFLGCFEDSLLIIDNKYLMHGKK